MDDIRRRGRGFGNRDPASNTKPSLFVILLGRMRRYKFELAGLNDWRQYRCASVAQTLDSISDDRRQAVR